MTNELPDDWHSRSDQALINMLRHPSITPKARNLLERELHCRDQGRAEADDHLEAAYEDRHGC